MKFACCLLAAGLAGVPTLAPAEVLIERTMLPLEAGPSSFAVGLPGGVNFCFDPVRGGLNYVWTGGFLDLTPVRPGAGKLISAAKLLGPVVYQEKGRAPLRRGDSQRAAEIEFKGYRLHDASVEFLYSVDGVLVREEISVHRERSVLVRRFHFEPVGADSQWWHVVEGRTAERLTPDSRGAFVLEVPLNSQPP